MWSYYNKNFFQPSFGVRKFWLPQKLQLLKQATDHLYVENIK